MAQAWNMQVPTSLRDWLDGWGCKLVQAVLHARRQWMKERNMGAVEACPHLLPGSSNVLAVGTDCSGADAPIFALRAMNIRHRHVFSCDNAAGPQQFIEMNTRPEIAMFTDLMKRDPATVPLHHIYVAGFPCKAFSVLNAKSKLWKERSAQPFRGVLRTIRACLPVVAVLENVFGLKRVLPQVLRRLAATGPYHVLVLEMDPRHLGEPVRRPRLYMLMIRRDVAVLPDTSTLSELAKHMWNALACERTTPVTSRMLPNDHPVVLAHRRRTSGGAAPSQRQKGGVAPRWKARHQEFCKAHGLPGGVGPEADVAGISAPREREAWSALCKLFPSNMLVADLSQCLTRKVCRTDGTMPTITPGANLMVRSLRRSVLPVEKLLLHAFPLHRLSLGDLSETTLSSLGGNTMHVQCVGAALAISLALTQGDITRPRAPVSRTAPQTKGRPGGDARSAKRQRTSNSHTQGVAGMFS